MKKLVALGAIISLCCAYQAQASILSVSGTTSNQGTAAAIIAAPSHATDAMVTNTGQQGFDERQGVVLASAIGIDGGGSIAAGTLVDSHMIFLNKPSGLGGAVVHNNVTWAFDGLIIGVMSNSNGSLEVASTGQLGAVGTTYPGTFPARGMEGADGYTVSANFITVDMRVTQPGDWIRVVTARAAVPEPTTVVVWSMLGGCMLLGRSRRKRVEA